MRDGYIIGIDWGVGKDTCIALYWCEKCGEQFMSAPEPKEYLCNECNPDLLEGE